jgi:hypothetical protein
VRVLLGCAGALSAARPLATLLRVQIGPGLTLVKIRDRGVNRVVLSVGCAPTLRLVLRVRELDYSSTPRAGAPWLRGCSTSSPTSSDPAAQGTGVLSKGFTAGPGLLDENGTNYKGGQIRALVVCILCHFGIDEKRAYHIKGSLLNR